MSSSVLIFEPYAANRPDLALLTKVLVPVGTTAVVGQLFMQVPDVVTGACAEPLRSFLIEGLERGSLPQDMDADGGPFRYSIASSKDVGEERSAFEIAIWYRKKASTSASLSTIG